MTENEAIEVLRLDEHDKKLLTNLAPVYEVAIQALEKQIPKKPIIIHEQVCDGEAEIEWKCPVCGRKCVDIAPCPEWCCGCGTRFDWS